MPEKRRWVKHESNMIEAKNNLLRQRSLDICTRQKLEKDNAMKESNENRSRRWLAKTKNSPYSVNLVAEDERVQEEHKTRTNDQKAEYIDTEERREKAKNDIILRVRFSLLLKALPWPLVADTSKILPICLHSLLNI